MNKKDYTNDYVYSTDDHVFNEKTKETLLANIDIFEAKLEEMSLYLKFLKNSLK